MAGAGASIGHEGIRGSVLVGEDDMRRMLADGTIVDGFTQSAMGLLLSR